MGGGRWYGNAPPFTHTRWFGGRFPQAPQTFWPAGAMPMALANLKNASLCRSCPFPVSSPPFPPAPWNLAPTSLHRALSDSLLSGEPRLRCVCEKAGSVLPRSVNRVKVSSVPGLISASEANHKALLELARGDREKSGDSVAWATKWWK